LAFLADETAPHPFYARGFILHEENRVPDLISRAYRHENASRFLLVKGREDYLADRGGIRATINNPTEEAMEAIGGTGDTLTGIAAALISADREIDEGAVIAAWANRLAGQYTRPSPATQVIEIINHIPRALADLL
jgi:NAD(P)H-hydrate repair Nnr-like enzyme with NAD(P)H-hydrate dehydratase domain